MGFENVLLTRQKIIPTQGGSVMHAMKLSDPGSKEFGEAYFSTVEYGFVKGWKRHNKMTLNLLVPMGKIRFVLCNDEVPEGGDGRFKQFVLSPLNYYRLTVPPMIWLAFQGLEKGTSLLLNVADIPHDPLEADIKDLKSMGFDWSLEQ